MAQSSGAWTYLMPSRRSAAGSSRRIASRYPEPVKGAGVQKVGEPEAFGRPVAMVMAYGFGDRTLASTAVRLRSQAAIRSDGNRSCGYLPIHQYHTPNSLGPGRALAISTPWLIARPSLRAGAATVGQVTSRNKTAAAAYRKCGSQVGQAHAQRQD